MNTQTNVPLQRVKRTYQEFIKEVQSLLNIGEAVKAISLIDKYEYRLYKKELNLHPSDLTI